MFQFWAEIFCFKFFSLIFKKKIKLKENYKTILLEWIYRIEKQVFHSRMIEIIDGLYSYWINIENINVSYSVFYKNFLIENSV